MRAYNDIRIEKHAKKDWKPFLNFIHALEERKNLAENVKSLPFFLYLDPTTYCNLQCPFCTTGQRIGARSVANMGLPTFEHIIDEIGSNLFHIGFYNWGEPLLNKDFTKMVNHIQKYYITSDVSTNLSFPIDEFQAKKLVDSGLDMIIMSVDGITQETYQKYRVGGNLELVLKNMKLLSKAMMSSKNDSVNLLWRFFVFKHNQHEMEDAKKIAKEIGVDIMFAKPFIDPSKFDEWASTIDEYRDHFWPYDDGKRDIPTKLGVTNPNKELLPWESRITFSGGCDWLWFTAAINANGSVSPCCVTTFEKQDFGNIENQSLLEIRNNKTYVNARKFTAGKSNDPSITMICQRCPAPEIMNTSDWTNVAIIRALLQKLPSEYEEVKKTPINNFDWNFVDKLKSIIQNEILKQNVV